MIHIGFTGTRYGMSPEQRSRVWELVHEEEFYAHHGDCVGADADFHAIVRQAPQCRGIIIHPADTALLRAYCAGDMVRAVRPPLERNHDIVDESELMIATPRGTASNVRSGTWTTIRYAQAAHRSVLIVMPDGSHIRSF